ncbi:Lrp/AsnC family transcriptional regulator [Marinomonas colpomeniae]|uniref:Lrp/AsnC family transcriptional regulator n=1 Tax=Marinomonas colpomeniae TaxID=2774408 RepID=A0ABR8P522_9GAMM|nr:Lrp/AsnC family transcriptional regulator [Marinomonas colpomeniae]MBD5772562.1 Lrp/AsnC family transcriptional regulator [Marinomonas colpomeniae]
MKLHQMDIRILKELQQDAAQTNLALAEKVGLSAPACLKRVHKLKAEGIIERIVAIVSPNAVDRRLNMVVEIEMTTDDLVVANQFIEAVNQSPEVKQCYKVTGEVDFVLIVNVTDIFEYEKFCQRVIYAHKGMKKFTTLISLRCTKFDLSQGGLSSI